MLACEKRFPGSRLLFQLDNAGIHKRKPPDALVAADMNVGSGGKQPVMRSGWYTGERGQRVEQPMVDEHGVPRGLKDVLIERRLFEEGMVKEDMIEVLNMQPDFRAQQTIVQEMAAKRGHRVLYSPKGYCELSAIEFGWKAAKDQLYGQKLTAAELAERFPAELDKIPMAVIRSWFDHCRAYLRAYEQGADLAKAVAMVKALAKQRRAERAAREAALTASRDSSASESSAQSDSSSESSKTATDSSSESASDSSPPPEPSPTPAAMDEAPSPVASRNAGGPNANDQRQVWLSVCCSVVLMA